MSAESVEKREKDRHSWDNPFQFFLATLGYCVGLGGLTRFPYMVMKNGGGAFLIPFAICMVAAAIPLFYMEILLGQFSGSSPLTMWSLCPAFKGLGYSMSLISVFAALYYMPFTWSTLFLVSSFTDEVPWATCNNDFNTESCGIRNGTITSVLSNSSYEISNVSNGSNATVATPSEEFWNYYILGINRNNMDGIGNIGGIRWQLALSHLFCWVFVFICCMKGAESAGKVVYVTATLPYLLLGVLFVRGITLDGSYAGLEFFLKPDFNKLADVHVWIEASIQVFFQLGPGWGALITMASYNKFHHPCYWDAIFVPLTNFITAIFGGVAIFSTLGFMATKYGIPIEEVAKSGPGLAFVAYPAAIAEMPLSPLWAIIFFLMIMSVAVDSQFGLFDTFVSGLLDMYPKLRKWQITVTAVSAAVCYLLGLCLCTEGGIYVYTFLDWYGVALTYTLAGLLECVVVAYIYGLKRFYSDVELMFGSRPNILFSAAWLFITPASMAVIVFVGLSNLKPPEYAFTNYHYPEWAVNLGWTLAIISFLPTPLMIIWVLLKTPGDPMERVVKAFTPDNTWLPNCVDLVPEYRRRWYPSEKDGVLDGIKCVNHHDNQEEAVPLKSVDC